MTNFNKHLFKLVCATVLIIAGMPSLQARENADQVVHKVRQNYEKIKTLEADFVQTIYWSLAEQEQKVAGKFFLAAHNKYRVETDNQLIVTDGTTVWTYSKDRNQLIINLLSESKENPLPRDLLLKYTREYRTKLKGETRINGVPCYEVEFTPQKEDAFILSTRIWVDKKRWLALKIEQEDINENITRYELSHFKINQPLPASLFTFTPTDSMEIVDLR